MNQPLSRLTAAALSTAAVLFSCTSRIGANRASHSREGRGLPPSGDGRHRLGGRAHLRQLPTLDGGRARLGRGKSARTARSGLIRTETGTPGATPGGTNCRPATTSSCVQSVVADGRGSVWALDAGAPAQSLLVPGARSWCASNSQTHDRRRLESATRPTSPTVSRPRGPISTTSVSRAGEGRTASRLHHRQRRERGARRGRPRQRKAVRVLDGDPLDAGEEGLVVEADGQPLRRPDGAASSSRPTASPCRRRSAPLLAGDQGRHALRRSRRPCSSGAETRAPTSRRRSRPSPERRRGRPSHRARKRRHVRHRAAGRRRQDPRPVSPAPPASPCAILVKDERLRWPDTLSPKGRTERFVRHHLAHSGQRLLQAGRPAARAATQLWRIVR